MSTQRFVGMRPKCYASQCSGVVSDIVLIHHDDAEKKLGVKRRMKDAHLHFGHYLDAPINFRSYVCQQNLIKSTSYTVTAVHMGKGGFTASDTKRYLRDDNIYIAALIISIFFSNLGTL